MSALGNIEMTASLDDAEVDDGLVATSERDLQRIQMLSEVLHGKRATASAAAVLEHHATSNAPLAASPYY
jgi:hypothetical protein